MDQIVSRFYGRLLREPVKGFRQSKPIGLDCYTLIFTAL